jgi:hypothetical protein
MKTGSVREALSAQHNNLTDPGAACGLAYAGKLPFAAGSQDPVGIMVTSWRGFLDASRINSYGSIMNDEIIGGFHGHADKLEGLLLGLWLVKPPSDCFASFLPHYF